ncbi:UDP-glucose 4-epimerase GalE [Paractinoplanes deccanensis]|uniref:UDP-glucose 4-epimerase n=1 Tax=Paractinoplanes deccanensis TaxID=113561 RepID=A0ABQ3YIT4_9ACTN|nr:UDP-glucose 4-epimerase GalE [Actinoplanes deccanensis]
MKVLITGGAGYIGSTVASACADAGIAPVVLDNLASGDLQFVRHRRFYRGDIADRALLDKIFRDHPDIFAVVHCAALVVVAESYADPLAYYRENVLKSAALVEGVLRNGCRRLIFSSSAAIYGGATRGEIDEAGPIAPCSPYARTKAMVEDVLRDMCAVTGMRAMSLRYFNPIGADPRLRSGPCATRPSHALGRLIRSDTSGEPFVITGVDYPTRDGTGLRDYVHVWDLARGHVAALRRFDRVLPRGFEAINLGTGAGVTVREIITAYEAEVGRRVPVVEAPRRPGDVAGAYASIAKAGHFLNWRPSMTLTDGIRSAIRWSRRPARRLPERIKPIAVKSGDQRPLCRAPELI